MEVVQCLENGMEVVQCLVGAVVSTKHCATSIRGLIWKLFSVLKMLW